MMKKLTAAAFAVLFAASALAAEGKVLGTVTKIEVTGKTAVATLQDESGKSVEVVVEDKVTLDKFADKRIKPGDEVKAKFEVKGGKNIATYFKKPGGC